MGSDTMLTTTIATSAASDEQHDVAAPHPALVEAAHALGVDEHGPEPQPGQERRRHAPRPLSRNSTIVAWVPTATMSFAPAS